jgi:vancomycin resistance protein YoaR
LNAVLTDGSINDALQHFPFTLTYEGKTWTISAETGKTLLGFIPGTTVQIGFDTIATATYLKTAAKEVAVAAVEPKLVLTNGKVSAFAAGTVGRTLNTEKTIAAMNTALVAQKATAVAVVDAIQPSTSTADTNALGITELVAEATTDFRGSPTNRRYNLGFGAKKINGMLIQPNETFSLVTTLGKIDGAHGWKPELVIKGSKITPEFGGGLCQVATTLFRSALNAGLPIVERTNHSLRISYYEPPVGLDATIYEPKPDLRFTNNYSTPLLIQTEVKGTKLIFRLYGTKDGRTVSIPTPTVYNKVGIPATKYIEVDTLKPGETKCQKPGHPGADAIATYTVTYPDGTKKVQTFKSHYRAIGVICQVGKAAASTPTNTNSGS